MKTITLTAKIKILPTLDERDLLRETMRRYSEACDFVSGWVFVNRTVNRVDVHNATYSDVRTRFGLGSQMAESVMRTVIAQYKTIRQNQPKKFQNWEIRPVFKSLLCDEVYNRDYCFMKGGKKPVLSIGTIAGRRNVRFLKNGKERYFDGSWRYGSSKLYMDEKGNCYFLLSASKEVPDFNPLGDGGVTSVVGIDRGEHYVAVSYDSDGRTTYFAGEPVRNKRRFYRNLRHDLQKRKTSSARRRLREIGSRENRYVRDVDHVISKALVNSHPSGTLFVLEDLNGIRNKAIRKTKRGRQRYERSSWAYFDLEAKLAYKAERSGDKIVYIDPAYTSQQCPRCGHVEKTNRNRRLHLFRCKNCGFESNDDRVGAINIWRSGIDYIGQASAISSEKGISFFSIGAASPEQNQASIDPRCDGNGACPASLNEGKRSPTSNARAIDGQSQATASNPFKD